MRRMVWGCLVLAMAAMVGAGATLAAEIRVMTSGGFAEAFRQIVPAYEAETGHRIVIVGGASMGGAPDSIPSRLARGEPADVVMLAGDALDALVRDGRVVPGSRVDLARSIIGMVVRAGAPKPDISTVEALTRTVREAQSFAWSASASGVYLSNDLFPRLGLADAMRERGRRIESERVATVVARGDAEIGFQQVSELLPIPGVDYVGPLPEAVQRVTIFSAGVAQGSQQRDLARSLIAYAARAEHQPVLVRLGLERPR
jgi:molybdate transport system substrate-binding protein